MDPRRVFHALRKQIRETEQRGISQTKLARILLSMLEDTMDDELDCALAYRLAWLIVVFAPSYDPVLVTTIPFCLENIAEGYASFDEFFAHILASEPVDDAPSLPWDLPIRCGDEFEELVIGAAASLRNDPDVLERIVDQLNKNDSDGMESCCGGAWTCPRCAGRRAGTRDVLEAMLRVESPFLMGGAKRLAPQDARRVAGDLVHVAVHDASWRMRLRATALLLDMARARQFDRV